MGTVEAIWVVDKCAVEWAWATAEVQCVEAKAKSLEVAEPLHLGVHLVHGTNSNNRDPKEVKVVGAVRGVTKVVAICRGVKATLGVVTKIVATIWVVAAAGASNNKVPAVVEVGVTIRVTPEVRIGVDSVD